MVTWYLGIPKPGWLARAEVADVPVFVSRTTLEPRRRLPVAVGRYALDSGGFTELQRHGQWTITPAVYVAFLYRCWREVGRFEFAAPMDWMCEHAVIHGGQVGPVRFVGTGLNVAEHQRRTVDNYLQLRALAPDLPIIPVLQGWRVGDYIRCAERYAAAGVDLTAAPLVGLGSVCRRQATGEVAHIIAELRASGIGRLHGFGFKTTGLRANWHALTSADSMAWSLDGRFRRPLPTPALAHRPPARI